MQEQKKVRISTEVPERMKVTFHSICIRQGKTMTGHLAEYIQAVVNIDKQTNTTASHGVRAA